MLLRIAFMTNASLLHDFGCGKGRIPHQALQHAVQPRPAPKPGIVAGGLIVCILITLFSYSSEVARDTDSYGDWSPPLPR